MNEDEMFEDETDHDEADIPITDDNISFSDGYGKRIGDEDDD